jgi:HAD superfamily hydrolase (TIGR01484 family)
MRYHALATDYDGTLAHDGLVDDTIVAGLQRLIASGRRLIMVTGRELPELLAIFPQIDLFELVVAENGALLYRPATKQERNLAEPPPEKFVQLLKTRGVERISVGRVIVATWEPHEAVVLQTIRDLGLDLQVIFNKGAVMILPASVNKASGLKAALKELGLSSHNVVAVGDAENDHAFLKYCEFATAVSNALPAVKDTADMVTAADHGRGVVELIDAMIADDLQRFSARLERHHLPLGKQDDGRDVALPPFGPAMLVAGPSASGKSTFVAAMLEGMAERKYQFCIVDPEGDYEVFGPALVLGGPEHPPVMDEVLAALNKGENMIVSLTGMAIADRSAFFQGLLPQLLQLRTKLGRPHWLVFDEAHQLLPANWQPPGEVRLEQLYSTIMISVHPELMDKSVLRCITDLAAVGQDPQGTLARFAGVAGREMPQTDIQNLPGGEVLLWRPQTGDPPQQFRANPSKTERRRLRRKYLEGELPVEGSFFFRGPDNKLNLRAQNLTLFLQMADGVDDATWLHHLRSGDYAAWFRMQIKDEELAVEAERIAALADVAPTESRTLVRAAIEREYTKPTKAPP